METPFERLESLRYGIGAVRKSGAGQREGGIHDVKERS
jgi:hypothetical protein